MPDWFPVRNGLKQGDALTPMLFKFALQHTIRRVHVNQNGFKLNGTHQLPAYGDDVNILGGSIHALKENAEALLAAIRETGLEVCADKTKYMVMSRDQNAGRNHSAGIDNSNFERVEEFKYLGTPLINQNSIAEETKSRLKSGSRSLTLRDERKLRVFQNMVLRRIFGPRRDEVTVEWRRLQNEVLSDLYSSPNIVRVINSRRMRWAGHVARMGEERGVSRVLLGKPEGRRQLRRSRRRWVDNIRMDLQEVGCGYMDWIGLAQDRDRWRTIVSAVMNRRVP